MICPIQHHLPSIGTNNLNFLISPTYSPIEINTENHVSTTSINLPAIAKLNGDNYEDWATNIETRLQLKGLYQAIVTEESPAGTRDINWKVKNLNAIALMMDYCEPSQQRIIGSAMSGYKAWMILLMRYKCTNVGTKVTKVLQLERKFTSMKMREGQTCQSFIDELKVTAEQLKNAGLDVDRLLPYRLANGFCRSMRALRRLLRGIRSICRRGRVCVRLFWYWGRCIWIWRVDWRKMGRLQRRFPSLQRLQVSLRTLQGRLRMLCMLQSWLGALHVRPQTLQGRF